MQMADCTPQTGAEYGDDPSRKFPMPRFRLRFRPRLLDELPGREAGEGLVRGQEVAYLAKLNVHGGIPPASSAGVTPNVAGAGRCGKPPGPGGGLPGFGIAGPT